MISGLLLCWMAALIPAVMLYCPNMAEISFGEMLPYFGILIGLGSLSWAVLFLVTRRKGLAAMAAAVSLGALLNVGRLVPALHTVFPLAGIRVIAPVTLLLLAAAAFGLSRLKEEFLRDAVRVAVWALAAFILSTAVSGFLSSPQREDPRPVRETALAADPADTAGPAAEGAAFDLAPAAGTDRPDLYWIISDEYAGLEELNKYYHYDNSPFYDRLRELGFTVSENSHNWRSDTYAILRDILNLGYVSDDAGSMKKMVADPGAPLWSLLKSLGYDLYEVEITNKFRLTRRMDGSEQRSVPETKDGETVANLLLRYSLLYRYEEQIISRLTPEQSAKTARDNLLNLFDWAGNKAHYPAGDRPSCTVIYINCPHTPIWFDRYGNDVPEAYRKEWKDKRYYLDQLVYTSGRLQQICGAILASDPDSIILLQSDHGKRTVANVTWLDLTNVLNAVYFRGEPIPEIMDQNALNTWIAVLRKQFRLALPDAEELRLENRYRADYYDPEDEDPNRGLIDPNPL